MVCRRAKWRQLEFLEYILDQRESMKKEPQNLERGPRSGWRLCTVCVCTDTVVSQSRNNWQMRPRGREPIRTSGCWAKDQILSHWASFQRLPVQPTKTSQKVLYREWFYRTTHPSLQDFSDMNQNLNMVFRVYYVRSTDMASVIPQCQNLMNNKLKTINSFLGCNLPSDCDFTC